MSAGLGVTVGGDVDPGEEFDVGRMAFKPGREPRSVEGAAVVEA